MAELLTAFLSTSDPLGDETEAMVDEVFADLEVDLGGIGEVVGWDVDADGVRLQLTAEEPERVIAVLVPTVRRLELASPWGLVAADPETGEALYERLFV